MTQNADNTSPVSVSTQKARNYYELLGLHPSASVIDIRRAYRDLSKRYHPDTAQLAPAIAKQEFQTLNEAYATLSSPERRAAYDRAIGYSSVPVLQPLPPLSQEPFIYDPLASAYIDGSDRPLSAGELFALFILAVTFVGCLLLAITVGLAQGEMALKAVIVPPEMVAPAPTIAESNRSSSREYRDAKASLTEFSSQPLDSQPLAPNPVKPNLVQPNGSAAATPGSVDRGVESQEVPLEVLPDQISAQTNESDTPMSSLPSAMTPESAGSRSTPESPMKLPDRAPEPRRVE